MSQYFDIIYLRNRNLKVLLVLSDFHMGILFEPIPLFPVLAGYCIGVACQLGVPVQVETVRIRPQLLLYLEFQ